MFAPEVCSVASPLSFLIRKKEGSGWNKRTEGSSCGVPGCRHLSDPTQCAPLQTHMPPYGIKKQK